MCSLAIPDDVLDLARRVARGIGERVASLGGAVSVDADQLITGRAALLGLTSSGRVSAGGATHLLAAEDGWCALTLSRADDVDAVPALLEMDRAPADLWTALADAAADRTAAAFVTRARMLDLPAAVLGEVGSAAPRFVSRGQRRRHAISDLLVADLSSMWAGPLCGHLLAVAGATVVKVESHRRPDGTRAGSPAFFDWMNGSKLCYANDSDDGLRSLLEVADVVIEASRPAALTRRGLGPDTVSGRPGQLWVRITGYGTEGEYAHRIAFGDDAAVAGGLVGPGPVFVGDAIADPLTGLEATRAVLEALGRGGGELIEVSLAHVAATYVAVVRPSSGTTDVRRMPEPPRQPASGLGADYAAVRDLVETRLAPC